MNIKSVSAMWLFLLSWFACAAERPNIVIILADDLGYADVGFQGCKDIPTPHLDALAKRGVRCSSGYVSHPFCSPTRAGLMTGRYQQRFGHENNPAWLPEDTKVGLPLSETFLVKQLQQAGYITGAIGKWHLGAAPCFHPNERGFTEYFGFLGGGHLYLPDLKGIVEYTAPILCNKEPAEFNDYMTDLLSREAVAFINRHKAKPFFLYVAYNAVHTPLQAPEKYLNRFPHIADTRRRAYAAMNSAMDDGVGTVMAALRKHGIEKNTVVFFLSDNGGPSPDRSPTDNTPLRGHKGDVFEGGIRVPFVVCWPGRLPSGTVYEQPVISLDILPTALALCGAGLQPAQSSANGQVANLPHNRLDGVNLIPFLSGENKASPHERLFWRTGGGAQWAVREGRYKLVKTGQNAPLLFDLQTDINESRDLAGTKPEHVARLTKVFEAWNAGLIPPLFQSPRPAARKQKQKK